MRAYGCVHRALHPSATAASYVNLRHEPIPPIRPSTPHAVATLTACRRQCAGPPITGAGDSAAFLATRTRIVRPVLIATARDLIAGPARTLSHSTTATGDKIVIEGGKTPVVRRLTADEDRRSL